MSSASGTTLDGFESLRLVLDASHNRPRSFIELVGDNGFTLMVGVGPDLCCMQFSSASGGLPYLVAVDPEAPDERNLGADVEVVDFLMDSQLTEVPRRWCLPRDLALDIVEHFVRTGDRSSSIRWEDV